MAEESTEKELKLSGLKGMDTSNPDGEPETNPILQSSKDKITSSDAYIKPATKDQSFVSDLANAGINGVTSDTIKGTNFMVDPIAKNLFTPVDLAKAIPDPIERNKYIKEHGNKMTQLLDPETYGITFNRQIADYAGYRKQNYPKQLKKFVDDLDENQGWVSSLGNNFAKLLGSTTAKIGANIIAPVYGIGSALYNMDGSKVRDNSLIDYFGVMDEDINKEFVVYGGYDYGKKLDDAGNVVGQQTFFSRLFSHPFKSINDDIIPTVAFVAGAVSSEVILGRLGIHTGASKLARNFFRAGAFGAQKFAKGYRVLRGLDKLSDIESMKRVIKVSNALTKGAGTIGTMYRSAAYESALIGNDTEDNTLMQSKFGYIRNDPTLFKEYQRLIGESTDEFGNLDRTQEELINEVSQKIPPGLLAEMKYSAKNAGKAAYLTNIPLVGASYMIQFPKIFGTSYRGGQKILSKTGPLYGATMTGGKLVSNFSKAKGFEKLVFKYALPSLKSGGTEAFEEFSQGVIEKGYADYWSAPYSDTSVESSIGFLQAMGSASRKYIKSVEGIDSITLGFLMGAIGIPMVKTKTSGKVGLGWSGGAYEAVQEVKEKISEVEAAIKAYNDGPQTNEVLKNNFDAFRANVTIQDQKEKALEEGDVYNYKNAEHDELHNYVENKMQNGILDTVYQDIEALKEMSLEDFNKQFAHKEADYQFTEESKKKNLETFEENIDQTVKAFDTTETVFNDKRAWVDRFFAKDYTGLNDIKEFATEDIKNAVKDQPEIEMAVRNYIRNKQNVLKKKVFSLLSTTNNLQKREKELQDRLRELAPNANLTALSKDENYKEVLAALEKGDKVYFAEEEGKKKLDSFISEILSNIKEENFQNYNLNKDEIKGLVNDIFKIKSRKAKISEIYSTLFTKKGANKWLTLQAELENRFQEELLEGVREQAEEAVNKKQDAASLKTVLDNYRQIFKEELPANSEKITEQLNKLKNKLDNEESYGYKEIIKFLKEGKNTNLIEHIFEVLENRDQMPHSLKYSLDNIDQFDGDQEFQNNFLDAFTTIYNNFENIIEEISNALTNPGNKKVENTTPEPSNEDFEKDTKEATTLDSMLDELIEEDTKGIIPTINEKKLRFDEDGNLIGVFIDSSTGKPETWSDRKGNPSNQPDIKGYNMKLVNSPDWLSNEYLEKNNVAATFKFSEDEYGDKANNDAANIGINVFHGDVFIGRLPAATSDPSSKALREALYNGKVDKDGTILGKESTAVTLEYSGYRSTVTFREAPKTETKETTTPDIEAKKADIEKRREKAFKIAKEPFFARVEEIEDGFVVVDPMNPPGEGESYNPMPKEEAIRQVEELNKDRKQSEEELKKQGFWIYINSKGKEIEDLTTSNTTVEEEINAAYDAELADLKTTTPETGVEAKKKQLGINENVLKIDSVGTTGSMYSKVRIQTPDGGILVIKPGTEGDLDFIRFAPKGMYVKRNDLDPYDEITLQDNFDEINKKENLIPQKLVDILIKEASFKGKKQTLENPQYTDIQKKIFAVSEKANIGSVPDQGPTKEYRKEILDPLSEFTDLFLKEIYEGEIEKHKQAIAYSKKKAKTDKGYEEQISTREEYIAVYENEIAALEQTTSPEIEVENIQKIKFPKSTDDFQVEFTDKEGKEHRVFLNTDVKDVAYFQLTTKQKNDSYKPERDSKGKVKNRKETDAFVRENLPKELLDSLLAYKNLDKENRQVFELHLLGIPLRGPLASKFFTPEKDIKQISKEFNKLPNNVKAFEKYVKPFVKNNLQEEIKNVQNNLVKTKNPNTIKKLNILLEDFNKAIAALESQPAQQTSKVETEVEQTAREKVIDKNFKDIIKALTANPIMQGDEFIGEKKC